MNPKWLQWAKLLQSIAQNGLTFAQDPYDRDRYTQLQRIAAEIMSTHSGAEFPQLLDLFQQERGYATPKVDVRAAVFRHNEILLVREREDGRWSLPGGWADVGESPSQVAVREIMEESGYSARAVKLRGGSSIATSGGIRRRPSTFTRSSCSATSSARIPSPTRSAARLPSSRRASFRNFPRRE